MAWITPITDWDGVTAGRKYFNVAELNRIEGNTQYLATYIDTFAALPALTDIKTDWALADLVFTAVLEKVESNIEALRTTLAATPEGWITLVTDWASLDKFDYIDANRLETDLLLLKTMAENISAALLFCGDFICGEGTEL